jgi:hypothetical protein
MLVELLVGACDTMVGAAVSAVVPAVKLGLKAFTAKPDVFVTALLIFTF